MVDKNIFIFRNYTLEPLFKEFPDVRFSGYEDISIVPDGVSAYAWFYLFPILENEQELADTLNDYKQKLDLVLLNCNPASFIFLFTITPVSLFTYQTNRKRIIESIASYNQHLYDVASSRPLAKVIDFGDFTRSVDNHNLIDWKYYFMYRTLINPGLSSDFAGWFRSQCAAIEGKRKKCLLLDLDNTLWGGVLGEEGMEGIQLGNSYPGNAFKTFQKMLIEASKSGVLLAVVSKNNEEDVWEAFEKHPDMILKKADLVAWRINWDDKANNIKDLAEELNIGLDSMVFLDDSPVERNWIMQAIPEVVVPDFPKHPYNLIPFFQDVFNTHFQLYELTREDKDKLHQYRQNSLRQQSRQEFSRIEDYIASLDIQITIREADSFTIPRIAQLTQKTNQFNLTTRRYTETDITSLISEGHKVYSASITDKFGDNGITAICIIKLSRSDRIEIDSYLLSCRVLGRFIEFALMKKLLNIHYDKGTREISANYLPTPKNGQVAEFYDKLGFSLLTESLGKHYLFKIQKPFQIESYYKFIIP